MIFIQLYEMILIVYEIIYLIKVRNRQEINYWAK